MEAVSDYDIKQGFFLLIDCATCQHQNFYTSDTYEGIVRQIKNDKWKLYPTYYEDKALTGNFANVCHACYRAAAIERLYRMKGRKDLELAQKQWHKD